MGTLPTGTVTFLFTDIEGSTKLAQSRADKWESLRGHHHAILKSAIESNNGYIFQIIGDAFCAAFHNAGEALKAAIKAQQDLQMETLEDATIRVRMGIHTGKAELQADGQYHGYLTMSRIQRLMSAGHGGQVLISATAQELLLDDMPENVSLRDLGERRLKDLIHPEHIYQLVGSGLPVEFPPLKTLDAYRHNLPVQLTSFIGREEEMREIEQALSDHRLVTLTGIGGTGKTRLALQVATNMLDQFPDGVWFVELAPITDSDLIPQIVLSTMGILEQPGLTTQQLLMDSLSRRRTLLILDNCEHLIETCARLVDQLINNAPALKVIATSREALAVPGEMIWQVPSLSLPNMKQLPAIEQLSQYGAVQLFIERATLVQPQFKMTNDNAPAVAQICFRLDGIPLAIELAAARLRAMSIEQIFKRLDNRFRLLTGGSRTALERHQTLRATIDWSYNLLSSDEKLLLARLSIFMGGWTLEAAEQVCAEAGGDFEVLDLLIRLVDKSLVILDGSRYRLLETTRQYAREKLFDSNEGTSVHDNHLAYFLNLAEQADKEIHGPDQNDWTDRLELEVANFRAALDWCVSEKHTESGLHLLGALSWAWFLRDHTREFRSWFSRIHALPKVSDYPVLNAGLLSDHGMQCWLAGNFREAQSVLNEAQAIWHRLGVDGELGLATTLLLLGMTAGGEGDNLAAQSFYERALELYQKHEDLWGKANALVNLGEIAKDQEEDARALSLFEESLDLFHQLGDGWGISRVSQLQGYLFLKQGYYEKAQQCFDQFLRYREGHKLGTTIALAALGDVYRYQRDYDQAEHYYKKSLSMYRKYGVDGWGGVLYSLAMLALHRDNYPQARQFFEEYFSVHRTSLDMQSACDFLMGMAALAAGTNQLKRAGKLYGAVQAVFEMTDYRIPPFDQTELDRHIQIAGEQLGEETFESFVAEGHSMTMEQAIEHALEETLE